MEFTFILAIIRSGDSKEVDTILPKPASNTFIKSETRETIKNFMIPIHEDVLKHKDRITVLYWRA